MARCNSCSAHLPANINRCTYCNVRNDVDLQGKHQYSITNKQSEHICPHCDKALQTVKLDTNRPSYIERCNTCFGLFFDPGEIEALLESSVSNVFEINLQLIKTINKDRYPKLQMVKYIKCPVCRLYMNRKNFGHSSGVIIDQCKKHGIWVDSGEISHLLEWKKAGGELLHATEKKKSGTKKKTHETISSYVLPVVRPQSNSLGLDADLLDTVSSLIYKLFR